MASPSNAFPSGLRNFDLPEGSIVYRIHDRSYDPLWWGPGPGDPPAYRFDAPDGEYRTLYCAQQLAGAFVETVLRRPPRLIARPYVDARDFTLLYVRRELKLVKLFDEGLAWHGVTNDICAGDFYEAPQQLALDLFLTFPDCDGIAYRARHNNGEIAYALFDRVKSDDLVQVDRRSFAVERAVADRLMFEHGAAWDPTGPTLDP